MTVKKIIFIVIVQFLFDDIKQKSLILLLYLGMISFFEIKSQPFIHLSLSKINYLSSLTILSTVASKLFGFAIMESKWNLLIDIFMLGSNTFYLVYSISVLIITKRNDIYYFVSSDYYFLNIVFKMFKINYS